MQEPDVVTLALAVEPSQRSLNITMPVLCRFYLQQLVDGKLDHELPPMGQGNLTQRQYTIDQERFMSNFKMQAGSPSPAITKAL